ncbi:hypothetical protein [Desulfonema magnum]|uniref:hypothetical protein n=1 Tax=Desulfonema magnum TaxID=45655 RepID=UPI001A9B91CD|nr:hypothetical protein [Desulfonema magnum]
MGLRAFVPSWHYLCLSGTDNATKTRRDTKKPSWDFVPLCLRGIICVSVALTMPQRHEDTKGHKETQKNLRETSCLCAFVAL